MGIGRMHVPIPLRPWARALTHGVHDDIADEHVALRESDAALLQPRGPSWAADGMEGRALRIRRQANSLPPQIRDHPSPEALLVIRPLMERAQPALDQWLGRRMSHRSSAESWGATSTWPVVV